LLLPGRVLQNLAGGGSTLPSQGGLDRGGVLWIGLCDEFVIRLDARLKIEGIQGRHARFSLQLRIEAVHQPVLVQDREAKVAVDTSLGRLVALQ